MSSSSRSCPSSSLRSDPTPSDFLSQSAESMAVDDGWRWMKQEAEHYRIKGATWFRFSIHPEIADLRLVEAWVTRPANEGAPRWALTPADGALGCQDGQLRDANK